MFILTLLLALLNPSMIYLPGSLAARATSFQSFPILRDSEGNAGTQFSASYLYSATQPSIEVKTQIDIKLLAQHWVNSHEEETANSDIKVYRPKNSREFPPSRFRMQYIFFEDGTCQWYYLSPTDGHHFRDGIWRIDVNEEDVIHIEQDGTVSYRIVELTEEVLRITPMTEGAS